MAKSDILFETANPERDPEGLITRYLQFESFRLVRDAQIDAMIGSLQERLEVLFWYLVDYNRHRKNEVSLLLSQAQIEFLNKPAPLAGVHPAATIALWNFASREMSSMTDLRNLEVLRKAVFLWCSDIAPRLKLQDRLVTKQQASLMRTDIQWINDDFPLSAYMVYYFERHTELHGLDMNRGRDRAAFFLYMIAKSFTEPHTLTYLPRESVKRLLSVKKEKPSVLDRALKKFCGPIGESELSSDELKELRKIGDDLLSHYQVSLESGRPAASLTRDPQSNHSGQCFLPPSQPIGNVEGGIAVIGPAFKASGLGQAMRLSVDVLTECEAICPTVYDFDLDNPAPVGFESATNFAKYQNRREVNLIHLNAESIPLAFAYLPHEIFEESYNIGFFFWELNEIPKCHRLALDLLDEIWVSSEYNLEIYRRFTSKPVVNVGMAVESLPSVVPMSREKLGIVSEKFLFLTTFDSFSFVERKNPIGVLEAFRRAFPLGDEPVALVLKTQNRYRVQDPYQLGVWRRIDTFVEADSRIVVVNETMQYGDLLALKRSSDCYVSLHRSEGWGFGMIEAMQLAVPVIATGYSGNMDFCTPETVDLVDFKLMSVRPEEYIFCERNSHWADPDLDHAASHMRAMVADPSAARAKGVAAAAFIAANFSVGAIAPRFAARLAEVRSRLAGSIGRAAS